MKTIVEADSLIGKIINRKIDKSKQYRLLKYLIRAECEYGVLLHNVITGELICLSENEAVLLNQLPGDYIDTLDSLIQKLFLVPVDFDEKKYVDQLRLLLRKIEAKKPITSYSIYPTTHCNARCFYCFESDFKHEHMTSETARAVSEYIAQNAKGNPANIRWFGGEPLVGIERIREICQGLKERGVPFQSSMVSNGYLFSDEIVQEAIDDWHLASVQITLDGTEQRYNRIKAYKNAAENPYIVVQNNIERLLSHDIFVTIRMNVDEANQEDLHILVNELIDRFGKYRGKIFFYARGILENDGYVPKRYTYSEKRVVSDAVLELEKVISEAGFKHIKISLPKLHYRSCWADSMQGKHITPSGNLKFCDHENDVYGNVFSPDVDTAMVQKWQEYVDLSACSDCQLYPECVKLKKCFDSSDCSKLSKQLTTHDYQNKMVEITVNKCKEVSF